MVEKALPCMQPEGSRAQSAGSKAKAAGQWAAKGVGAVANAAKETVTGGGSMASEDQNPAGSMQQRCGILHTAILDFVND